MKEELMEHIGIIVYIMFMTLLALLKDIPALHLVNMGIFVGYAVGFETGKKKER